MRDETRPAAIEDAELSAWIDGELPGERATELRDRVASDARLARRVEVLRRVDDGLRALPAPPLPADLRERLAARIAADEGAPRPARRRAQPAPRRRGLRRAVWAAAVAAGAAAAVGLWLRMAPGEGAEEAGPRVAVREPARPPIAVPPAPAPQLPPVRPGLPAPPGLEGPLEPTPPPTLVARPEPGPPSPTAEPLEPEEIALALELEALEDLEVIEHLDLLLALERGESGDRG